MTAQAGCTLPIALDSIQNTLSRESSDTTPLPGGVSADTILNGGPRKTVQEMYPSPPTHLLAVDLGAGRRLRNRVLGIHPPQLTQLYRLVTPTGYLLRASADHLVLTAEGWVRVSALVPGQRLVVNRKDASRIGCCTTCGCQTKARGHQCHACANKERESARIMSERRDPVRWKESILRGPLNPNWGKKPARATLQYPDLPHAVRGHWEADFARVLIAQGIPYEYEPRTFILSNGSAYTPDFYLPTRDLWVEIRNCGATGRKKLKYEMFQREYPEVKIITVRAHEIAEFELAHQDLQPWNCPTLPAGFEFEPVGSVREDGVHEAYRVLMEHPLGNCVANGIVVHCPHGNTNV